MCMWRIKKVCFQKRSKRWRSFPPAGIYMHRRTHLMCFSQHVYCCFLMLSIYWLAIKNGPMINSCPPISSGLTWSNWWLLSKPMFSPRGHGRPPSSTDSSAGSVPPPAPRGRRRGRRRGSDRGRHWRRAGAAAGSSPWNIIWQDIW